MGTWWDVLAKALEDLPSSLVSRDLGIGLRDTASATQVSQTNAVSEVFFGQPSPIQLGSLPGLGRNENIMNFLNSPAPSNYPQFKHELSCEGDVSCAVHTNILHPVCDALNILLKSLLEALEGAYPGSDYKFNVRTQVIASTDNARCDHYLVLESRVGLQPNQTREPGKMMWSSTGEMWRQLQEAAGKKRSERDGAPNCPVVSAATLPHLVLCVIEEKKPETIIHAAFVPGYEECLEDIVSNTARDIGGENVVKILPQVKRYSADSNCPIVAVTDYLQWVFMQIDQPEALPSPHPTQPKKIWELTGYTSTITVHSRALDADRPRLVFFMLACRRLADAGLVNFNRLPVIEYSATLRTELALFTRQSVGVQGECMLIRAQ